MLPHTTAILSQVPLQDHGWSLLFYPWLLPGAAVVTLGDLVGGPPNAPTGLLKPFLPERYTGGT